jgi:hypothetical protein
VEDFCNHYQRTEALKSSSSHSGFATLGGETQEGERERLYLYGGKHGDKPQTQWEKCEYISPKIRSSRWKGKPETFEKINKVINSWKTRRTKWFIEKFEYDGLKDPKPTTKEGDSRKLGSFITYSRFTALEDYKLYNS